MGKGNESLLSKYTLFIEGNPIGDANLTSGPLKQVTKQSVDNNKTLLLNVFSALIGTHFYVFFGTYKQKI